MTDPSGAQEGLDQVEQAAEQAAQKTASAAAKAADSVVSETEEAAQKAAAAVKSAAGKGEKEAADAGAKVRKTSKETSDKVGTDADSAGQKTQRSAKETKEKVVSQFTAGQVAIGNIISKCVDKVVDAGKTLISTGVSYNAEIEKYRTALTNLLGDAEKANAALAAMQADAARTPFDTATLVKSNEYLISAGENAEYSRKTILALGDAVAATGGGSAELERMAQNLQQVANQGKATSVDIKQFAMAGINIYQVLADYTGKSVQDVQSMTITYDVLTQALQAAAEEGGRYYGSMETQSETLSGRITTLQDNAKQLAGELSTGLSSAYGTVVEKANEWVTSILSDDEKLQQLNTTVTVVTAAIAAGTSGFIAYRTAMAISGVISAVRNATEGMTIAQAALNAVMSANPVAIVVTALAALAGGLATAYAANENFREGWNSAWSSIKDWFSSVADYILDKLNVIMAVANGVGNAIAALGRLESPVDAYNAAYHQTRQNYADNKTQQRQKDGGHARRTSNGGMWSDKLPNTASNAVISSIAPSTGGTTNKKKATSTKSATETLLWSLQDVGTSVSQNALGKVTTQTTELTEHLKKGSEEYDRLTKTVTESGKEMVNGVAKNYKTVTKYVTENGKTTAQTQKVYEEIAATVAKTVTSTTDSVVNGIATSTKTITETLTDKTTTQKQVITETYNDIVDGALVTVERVKTIAADGVPQINEEIKKASANSFDGLVKGWQDEADKGVVGTFSTLVNAVKKQDWQSVGEWVLSTLYNGLAPQAKQLIDDFGKNLIQQVNGLLGKGVSAVSNGLWDMGGDLAKGLTSGFADVITQAQGLGSTLTGIFQGLKGPLTAAAAAISTGLKGGLISSFPEILASMGTLIGSIGSAFVGMLEAVAAALFPTGFGAPQALLMIAAGVALTAAIAAIVAGVGGAFKRKTTPGISGGTSGSSTTSTASGSLWDYEKRAPLPQRTQRPNIEVNQYIYSKAQTAADLMREAQYEQERAVLQGV